MEKHREKEEFEIDISLSDEFYNIYKDQANAIAYARNHRTHKCYNCNKYGHIAKECGRICSYCNKFHPTTTCLGKLIDLLKRILQKMDNSYNKNLVFLNKLINRNYDDLQWILSKKHFENLSIVKQELQIQPTYVYDEEALKELQKYNFKPQVLKDTIDVCNDEDDNEINNFHIFNQYKKNNKFVSKIQTSEDKKYKYYKIIKNNKQFKVDTNNIKEIKVVNSTGNKNKFTIVNQQYYSSIYDKSIDPKYLRKSFNDLKAQVNKILSDTVNKILNKDEGSLVYIIGDPINNALCPKALEILKLKEKIKENARNKVLINKYNEDINKIKEEMYKSVLNESQYYIFKNDSISTLIKFCDENKLFIEIISKIIEIEPTCTLRTNQMKSVPYLSAKLKNYSDIYKEIKGISDARKEINKLNKKISDLESCKNKKNKSVIEIMEKFNNIKEKYLNKKKEMFKKYKNEVRCMKQKYKKNKKVLDDRLDRLRNKKSQMYESIGRMVDKSRDIYDHINRLRDKQIELLKQQPHTSDNRGITYNKYKNNDQGKSKNKNKGTYYKEEKYDSNGNCYDADGF